ncbi:MAG: serine/threonine protein kinase [Myxococcota bacterium]
MPHRPIYRIDHIPATGSYATIVVVEDSDAKLVALKVLRRDLVDNPEHIDRLYDEAVMLAQLRHPNILRVDEVLHISGRPVIVMEWVRGVSLDRVLHGERGKVPLREAVEIARQTALALQAAYEAPGPDGQPMHIVHRDVKPSNILLSVDGQVKLADFGVAKGEFTGRQSDSLYLVHGSLSFTAPERLEGAPDEPTVDVYALGLSLFELATGRQMILSRQRPRHDAALADFLTRLCPDREGEDGDHIRAIVGAMCAHDPALRPSPADAAARLQAWLEATGGPPHLDAWAWEEVAPLLRDAMIPAVEHPSYSDVAFLQDLTLQQVTQEAQRVQLRTTAELDEWLHAQTSQDMWWTQLAELMAATRTRDDWSVVPFLVVLSCAQRPWWNPWAKLAQPAEVAASLELLRHRASPDIRTRASRLVAHPSQLVAEAAKRVMARAARPDRTQP